MESWKATTESAIYTLTRYLFMGNHLFSQKLSSKRFEINIYFWTTSTKWSVYFNSIALYIIIVANMQVNSIIVLKLLPGTSQAASLNASEA